MQTRSKTILCAKASHCVTPTNSTRNNATPKRPVKAPAKIQRARNESDNDSTSTYCDDDADNDVIIPSRLECDLFEPEFIHPMQRQQRNATPAATYEVSIDFDEASIAWRANKLLVGEGHYAYKCDSCNRRKAPGSDLCRAHRRAPAFKKNNRAKFQGK